MQFVSINMLVIFLLFTWNSPHTHTHTHQIILALLKIAEENYFHGTNGSNSESIIFKELLI